MARTVPMSDKMIALVATRFSLLGDPTRLRILQALERGEQSVNQVVGLTRASQPNISKHLRALTGAGLVSRRREGNNILYAIADPVIFKLCDLVCRSATNQVSSQYRELLGNRKESRR